MIYNLLIRLYGKCIGLAGKYNAKAKLLRQGQKNALRYLECKIDKNKQYIWFHAASLGEFEQGRPLIERVKREQPDKQILLTFFSPSGYEVRKDYPLADVITYLPLDTTKNARRFMQIVRPSMAIFIKYEFWPNFLGELSRKKIPTYLVSGIFRPKQYFFRRSGFFFKKLLNTFTHFFLQDENSGSLLSSIGIKRYTVCGDTRFDRVIQIMKQTHPLPMVKRFAEKGGVILVAGSSWPKDESFIIPYFNTHPELRLIIAPHQIDEAHLLDIESRIERPYLRFSQATLAQVAEVDCLIMDCFGLLSSIYRYGHMAYIGGGFGSGLHNTAEAAVYGIPLTFGSKFGKFKEAKDMVDLGGAVSLSQCKDFAAVIDEWINNPEKREMMGETTRCYIMKHSGATDIIYSAIFEKK